MPELPGFVGLNCFFRVQSAGQVINHRQQLTRDISNDTVVRFAAFALDSFTIVFKIRLPARESFLCFIQRGLETFQLRARSDEFRQAGTSKPPINNPVSESARSRAVLPVAEL